MKRVISFLIPIMIAIIVTNGINITLDNSLLGLKQEKDISLLGKKYGDFVKDKSAVIKDLLSDKGDLFLLGSSEMGVQVPQNPLNMFPVNDQKYDLSCFGRPYSQNLQQATYLGSGNINQEQKVAYIVSLEWFEDADAIKANNFAVNFSDIQFYRFLKNPKISQENKEYYTKRVYTLLSKAKKYPAEALYARLYYSKSPVKKCVQLLFEPYYSIKEYMLNIKDKALIYKELKGLPNKSYNQEAKNINWKDEEAKIEKENNKITFNNQFHLDDKYYNSHEADLAKTKNESQYENPIKSKEMDDYRFFLSVCKELDIKPYIIMLPINGWYYDYLGLPKEKRYEYYDEVKELANENKLNVLDLRDDEYKEGFLIDTMHFGKEGWLKVSEEIYKHFNKE